MQSLWGFAWHCLGEYLLNKRVPSEILINVFTSYFLWFIRLKPHPLWTELTRLSDRSIVTVF